jgi:hypothetical protein
MENKRKESSSLERQIKAYPHPKYYAFIVAKSFDLQESKSTTIGSILRLHFDGMPKLEQERLQRIFSQMTADEKKRPGSLTKSV